MNGGYRYEGELLAAVLGYLELLEAQGRLMVWRNNTGAMKPRPGVTVRFGTPGAADVLAVLGPHGRLLGVETKSVTGTQSIQQKRWAKRLTAVGGIYVLAKTLQDVKIVIEKELGAA